MIIRMAWKNMLRYKKRSIITASAISIGIIFSIFTDGLMFGIDRESSLNLVNTEIGACRMYADGYYENRNSFPIEYLLNSLQQKNVEQWMSLNHNTINYTSRFVSSCEIIFNNEKTGITGSIRGILNGIKPEKDSKVFNLERDLESGVWFSESTTSSDFSSNEGVVLGSAIAHDLSLTVGDWITIQTKGLGGFEQTMDSPVIGIIRSTNPTINTSTIYMDYTYVNEMLELDNSVTEYDFQLGTLEQIDKRFTAFKNDFLQSGLDTNIEIFSWKEIAVDILALTESKTSASGIMIFFMFVIAAVGITNTILMSVMERKNEIAMLRALGYSNSYIKRLFVLEGINIGILGAFLGTALSIPITWYFVTYGIDFSSLYEGIDIGFRISSVMRSGWHISAFFTIPLGALVIAAISAWLPTRPLLKQQVATIFRSV